ncbi:UDP-N-acetylmuramyl pentapeptide phosphotransferase [Microbacterium oleivorans]|uniref:UDP-N-acetylmuramyl pentapeptide phosphotransferase n=1 Tax=Microbacterium oleivorans TaxID=273677 RepID=A0A7D5IVM7_9MICO|nr:UDP-N-acetylmuramyl pentapeptide phosphotransferase [Microbacterium oleivorans]QLD10616.1 UDP-N-acetylmuramyl pentapeptide phosphotransferase [Microbacterium oleivorans]
MSTTANSPQTGQVAVAMDPARRPDVLLRRRHPEGYQVSAWWMIGAFVAVSVSVVALVNMFPG